VAEDAGPIASGRVDELRVGVVGDVEEIEARPQRQRPERVFDVARRQPIGVERGAGAGDPADDAADRDRDRLGVDLGGVSGAELREEHLGDEVHAPPPLLERVGEHGEARRRHSARNPSREPEQARRQRRRRRWSRPALTLLTALAAARRAC
jgi:hypothetical protein